MTKPLCSEPLWGLWHIYIFWRHASNQSASLIYLHKLESFGPLELALF